MDQSGRQSCGKYLYRVPLQGDYRGESPFPEPTSHLPGSEGKIQVLCQRALMGESLFHRFDAGLPDMDTRHETVPSFPVEVHSRAEDCNKNYHEFLTALDRQRSTS